MATPTFPLGGILWWALVNSSGLPNWNRWLYLLQKYKKIGFKIWDKPKWGNPLLFGETDFTVGFADRMFPIRCANCCGATTTANRRFFLRKTAFYNGQFWISGAKWGWKFLHQTTKRHTLTPNLVEQIVWRMWQWRCFDTILRREKKVRGFVNHCCGFL